MNKMELISAVATKADLTQKDATKAVNVVFETIAVRTCQGRKNPTNWLWYI